MTAHPEEITWRDRLRYQFDNIMSRGPIALIAWLFILSAAMIIAISLFVVATGIDPEERGFLEVAWASMLRTLDPGTMGGDTGSWPFLLAMLAVTLGGVFVVSALIGVLTTGLEGQLERLRKGRSFVAETGHTVILGWSPQVFTVVSELVLANANQRRACIAILADQDKVAMEDEMRARVSHPGRTRIVCRTGNPMDLTDLAIVNPHRARAIIILAPETEDPDVQVIKALLALTQGSQGRAIPRHIVAVIHDPRNMSVARLAGGDAAQLILAGDLIARIAAQTCRQSGLSTVYTELLNFSGDEIYFQEEPGLVGRTFGEALLAYEDSTLLGLRFKDGRVKLNPPMTTRIEPGDQVIAISEDDDTVRLSGRTDVEIAASAIREAPPRPPAAERTLILGWNQRALTLVTELDHYVGPDSEITIAADMDEVALSALQFQLASRHLQNLRASLRSGDTTDRRWLDELAVQTYDHVIVLSYSDTLEAQQADARTLVTLLHLRDIADRHGHPFSIVSEMLDVRNRELAEVTRADDFILSHHLTSLMLAQIAESRELAAVFQDLFDPAGSELYLKPAGDYVELGQPVNFYTVVEAARRRGEVALGYRRLALATDAAQGYGVVVNPDKSRPVTFEAQDRIIVLAED